jgi:hypothetical protein
MDLPVHPTGIEVQDPHLHFHYITLVIPVQVLKFMVA